jgi:uncharacterized protein (DUF1778 family)
MDEAHWDGFGTDAAVNMVPDRAQAGRNDGCGGAMGRLVVPERARQIDAGGQMTTSICRTRATERRGHLPTRVGPVAALKVAVRRRWPYTGRTREVMVATTPTRSRSERLEVRTTKDERALIDRAVAEQGTDLTEFVVSNLTVAARRVLADRTEFTLDAKAAAAWDAVNRRRARELPGLLRLMERPSPFASE